MVTSVEIDGPTGETGAKIELFEIGGDTVIETINTVTERTNKIGSYTGTVATAGTGDYDVRLIAADSTLLATARRRIEDGDQVYATSPVLRVADPMILLDTTVALVNDQTHLELNDGPAVADVLNNRQGFVVSSTVAGEFSPIVVVDSITTDNEIVLQTAPGFTVTADDRVVVLALSSFADVDIAAIAAAVIAEDASTATGTQLGKLVSDLVARLTAARTGYLDYLNVGGMVASAADVQGVTQAQRVQVLVPTAMERPDSGSTVYRLWIYAYGPTHLAENLDANPVVTAQNNAGTDRSANLGTVTKPAATNGQYYVDYTVANSHAIEQIVIKVDATEGGNTTQYSRPTIVAGSAAISFTAADRTKLDTLHDTRLTASRAAAIDNIDVGGAVASSAELDAIKGAGWTTETLKDIRDNNSPLSDTDVQQLRYRQELDGATAVPVNTALPKTDVIQIEGTDATDTLSASLVAPNGGGANLVTITVQTTSASPISGATVQMTHEASGSSAIAVSNASGEAVLACDDYSDWDVSITATGYVGATAVLAVSGATSQTYSLVANYSATPSAPGHATGSILVLGCDGNPDVGVDYSIQYQSGGSLAGVSPCRDVITVQTDASGIAEFTGMIHNATYKFARGTTIAGTTGAIPFATRTTSNTTGTVVVPVATSFNITEATA